MNIIAYITANIAVRTNNLNIVYPHEKMMMMIRHCPSSVGSRPLKSGLP